MKKYSTILKRSESQYLALCLELGVIGSGFSPNEAKRALFDAIESYLDYVKEEGTPEERPVSIKELHEFLYYDELFEDQEEESSISLKVLDYA